MMSWRDGVGELGEVLGGPVFVAGSAGYKDEVAGFDEAVVHRPAVVVGAESAADVGAAVVFASRHGMNVAVVNTGHGPSVAAGPQTMLITTRRMTPHAK